MAEAKGQSSATLDSATHLDPRERLDPPGEDLTGRRLLHFHIVERLGAGGMGVVYKAIDEKLRRPVALKVLAAKYLVDDRNKELIFREARSAAAVHHPNIATIYDVHNVPQAAFLAMEFVDGETLRARIERGRLPSEDALSITRQIVEGLACAHEAGVVHRDVKPENVMLSSDGRVKLLDFGLAKVIDVDEPLVGESESRTSANAVALAPTLPASSKSTARGRVMGTPIYMAPEQARGEPVDARADVFALGVVLYEMLTGKAPFVLPAPSEQHGRAKTGDWTARKIASLRRLTDKATARLVHRCLEPDPSLRFADASELSSALRAIDAGGHRRKRGWALLAAPAAVAIGLGWLAVRFGVERTPSSTPRAPTTLTGAPPSTWTERRVTSLEQNVVVNAIALSHDRGRVAFVADNTLWVQQIASGDRSKLGPVERPVGYAYSLDWFPGDREILVGSAGNPLDAIDVKTRARRRIRTDAVLAKLSPDATRLALRVSPSLLRVEGLEGQSDASLSVDIPIPPERHILDVAWAPTEGRLALLTLGPHRGEEEIYVATLDGAAPHAVVHGQLLDRDGSSGLAWRSNDRLLFTRRDASAGGTVLAELVLDRNVEPVADPLVVRRWAGADPWGIVVVGDTLAFVLNEMQDDVFVGGLSPTGDRLVRALERATQSDSNDALVDWTSGSRFAFVSNRRGGAKVGIFVQDVFAETPQLVSLGPPSYSARGVELTDAQHALFWRGDAAAVPSTCELVSTSLEDGSDRVALSGVPRRSSHPDIPSCGSRFSCAGGRCVTEEDGTLRWLDPATGRTSAYPHGALGSEAAPLIAFALARDGRVAASFGARATVVRPDGTIDGELPMPAEARLVSAMSFAPDGRRVVATFSSTVPATTGLAILDVSGVARVLTAPDGRWRGNPRVSPDGRSIAVTVRARQENIGLLELTAATDP